MNIIPFRVCSCWVLATLALACGEDGSDGETNADSSGVVSDGPAGSSGETSGSSGVGENGMETGSAGTDSTGPGDETGESGEDSSSSGGSPVVECPDRAQTCESLAPLQHCDLEAAFGLCIEYLHECTQLVGLEDGCVESGGSFGEGACPTPGSVGTCIEAAELQLGTVLYEVDGVDAGVFEQECVGGGGTWCGG